MNGLKGKQRKSESGINKIWYSGGNLKMHVCHYYREKNNSKEVGKNGLSFT